MRVAAGVVQVQVGEHKDEGGEDNEEKEGEREEEEEEDTRDVDNVS